MNSFSKKRWDVVLDVLSIIQTSYFVQAIDNIDIAHVMTTAENVCSALGFRLDNNWEAYLSELTKFSRTIIYLSSLELHNSSEVAQAEELKNRIICTIYFGPNGLK